MGCPDVACHFKKCQCHVCIIIIINVSIIIITIVLLSFCMTTYFQLLTINYVKTEPMEELYICMELDSIKKKKKCCMSLSLRNSIPMSPVELKKCACHMSL